MDTQILLGFGGTLLLAVAVALIAIACSIMAKTSPVLKSVGWTN